MTTTQEKENKRFQLSIDFFDRPEICAVTVEHGTKGQAATIMLLCAIYNNGYFIEWKPENCIVILKELPGINISKMQKIVKTLVEWGFFDRAAFEEHQVLTNREIQQQYFASLEDGLLDVGELPYWLTDNNGENTNEGIEDNKEDTQQTQAAPDMAATIFPASPVDCIEYILQDQPLVEFICTDYKITLNALRDWLEMFAEESRFKGKETYDSHDDLMDYLHYWLIKGTIKTADAPKTPFKNQQFACP